jgi:hypothetical protein
VHRADHHQLGGRRVAAQEDLAVARRKRGAAPGNEQRARFGELLGAQCHLTRTGRAVADGLRAVGEPCRHGDGPFLRPGGENLLEMVALHSTRST